MRGEGGFDYLFKIVFFGRIEIHDQVVGILKVLAAAGPGIHVDAAQVGEVKQSAFVVANDVVDIAVAAFGIDFQGIHEIGGVFRRIFMIKAGFVDAIGKAVEALGAVLKMGQDVFGHAIVILNDLAFGDAFVGEVDFVGVGDEGFGSRGLVF